MWVRIQVHWLSEGDDSDVILKVLGVEGGMDFNTAGVNFHVLVWFIISCCVPFSETYFELSPIENKYKNLLNTHFLGF